MKLGFIGTGNMAGAIMGGIIRNGVLKPEEIIGSDILEAGREKVHSLYGICVTDDNREAAKAEIVVLSVVQATKSSPSFAQTIIREFPILYLASPMYTSFRPFKVPKFSRIVSISANICVG